MNILLVFTFTFFAVKNCEGGSVLFLPPMTSASHKLAMVVWADALAERGHDVYWWAPAAKLDKYQPSNTKNVQHYEVDVDDFDAMETYRYENSSLVTHFWWNSDLFIPGTETYSTYRVSLFCEKVINEHKESVDWVLSRKYDLIIIDELFNPCGLMVTQMLKAPVATYVSTCRLTRTSIKHNGVAVPHSYVPDFGLSRFSDSMSFFQRVFSTVNWGLGHLADSIFYGMTTTALRKYNRELESIDIGLIQPQFQFLCVPLQLDTPQPITRNLVYIGGLQIPQTVPPLTGEFQTMVDQAKKGFIVIGLGHWANWLRAPIKFKNAFIEAFSKISDDYVIFWQYNGLPIPDLPKHIKLVKWMPQRSLLAHPKCALFVTHAGCNSLTEGVHYAVPMIAIPLSADQPDGAVKISNMGFGLHLHKLTFTAETLYNAMSKVLTDKTYKKNVERMSNIIKNDTMTSLERAVFWTEFAMKRSDKQHYRPWLNVVNLSSAKYHCLDIIVPSLLFLFFIVRLFISCTKRVCTKFRQR